MRPPFLPLLGFLTLSVISPLSAAEPLAALLPDKSHLFFNISNLAQLRESHDHPLMKTISNGELGKALKTWMENLKSGGAEETAALIKAETGLTPEEILTKFPGQAAGSFVFNLPMMTMEPGAASEADDFGAALIMDYTGDEALIQKMLATADKIFEETAKKAKATAPEDKAEEDDDSDDSEAEAETPPAKPKAQWPEDYEEKPGEVEGVKIHQWIVSDPAKTKGPKLAWSLANGKVAFAVGDIEVEDLVRRLIKSSPEGSLGSTSPWKTLPDSIQESDLLGGVNLEALLGQVQEGLRQKMDKGELNTGSIPINPLQAWTGAGLDQFRMGFVDVNVGGNDATVHLGLTYAEKPALMKLYAAKGPGTPPLFVPADVQEVSWGTFDWGAFYDNFRELATAVSPMAAGGIEMGTTELKKRIGVDLRKDILGQMGDALWSVSHSDPIDPDAKPEEADEEDEEGDEDGAAANPLAAFGALAEGQSQVLGIGLRDAKAFELSLKSIFNTLAPGQSLFDDREFMETTIHEVKGLPASMQVAWLIRDETMILSVGKPDLLEKVLTGMAKPPTNPLVNEPHVKDTLAKMPEGGVSSGYAHAGQIIDIMWGAMKPLMEENAEGEGADLIKDLPSNLNLPWYLVSKMYVGDTSSDVRIVLSAKP